MKIWSDTLHLTQIHEAANRVNLEFPGCAVYVSSAITLYEGERTRRFDKVNLRSSTGRWYPNTGIHGADRSARAASWCEWGWWLYRVFEFDPSARCGDYLDLDDFNRQTGGRFLDPRNQRQRQVIRELNRGTPLE